MEALVCPVTTEVARVVELRDKHGHRRYVPEGVRDVGTTIVFTDIDKYWEAIRRGPPA